MRKHARSDTNRKLLRRISGAEIGSRVFPFRSPPPSPATMPTVGTRRSTKVFVPKQQQRQSDRIEDRARVLRSGKRFALSKSDDGNEWLKVIGGGNGSDLNGWWRLEGKNGWKEEMKADGGNKNNKLYGTVYSRKRRRSSSSGDVKDRKFGIFFERKRHRKKVEKVGTTTELRFAELSVADCSKNFAAKRGIFECDIWSGGLVCGSVVLAVFVDLSLGRSLERFERLLVLVMSWMRRARVGLWDFVALLFSRSIGGVFSVNGIHFLPVRNQDNGFLVRNTITVPGFCKIFGAREFIPLLSVDYSALPFYFKSLHANIIHNSQYLPGTFRMIHQIPLQENPLGIYSIEEHVCLDNHIGMESSRPEVESFEITAVHRDDMQKIIVPSVPVPKNSVIFNCSKLPKHQKKRSSLRNSRPQNLSFRRSHFGSFYSDLNMKGSVSSTAKPESGVSPDIVKQLDSCSSDLFSGREESGSSSSQGSHSKLRKLSWKKSPVENVKELRLALAEVRQNIDSASCNANILITDTDKCWREDGANVMLEMSSSQEWFIAVKRGDVTKYVHKPQDMRPCVVNRFTHAYMWSSDDGWKLEFWDKWDWQVFKELHRECRDRNFQEVCGKIIPVPGVREVSGYEEDAMPSFVRPSTYIHVLDDEVGRALVSENAFYDMDLEDEQWLRRLNSTSTDVDDGFSSILEEKFERIIFTLERYAYNCLDDASDKERALDFCEGLGKKDMVSAIYDYWFQKRNQRCVPLVRVFQGPPLRRAEFIQKPFLRKKRSFKRQRSQAERNQAELFQFGRGKPDLFSQTCQIARNKVEEAEAAAFSAAEVAIQLRTRAQMLMSNADLASYKATIAHRIADTIFTSPSLESPDLDSSILFD